MSDTADPTWLTIPDLVAALGLTQSQVRRLIEDRSLLAARKDGVLQVPADFVKDGAPLGELRGTIVVLGDAGFSDDEAIHWLLNDDDSLGVPPISALRAGRKAEVRRVAQALGF
ncbi:MAG: Rv2175c family DNA-binding protein [Pseudolysinimonas sp.]